LTYQFPVFGTKMRNTKHILEFRSRTGELKIFILLKWKKIKVWKTERNR